ncbi:hypothetical protein FOZ60_006348 [Perkinsus olseni]|uniref:Sel-1 suppressor of lin-12-like n=1 Tax=Perkinsus olseni TaxID=32597 RepID=A0A7J6RDA9_PEROL|nr:hypothetical protein FOZ60_006348 [Perkinsus olseni]KAF4718603.1 hypothetical protein FOZ62_008303 [Perkinsus olseni]
MTVDGPSAVNVSEKGTVPPRGIPLRKQVRWCETRFAENARKSATDLTLPDRERAMYCCEYGGFLLSGYGVHASVKEALKWLRIATGLGDPEAAALVQTFSCYDDLDPESDSESTTSSSGSDDDDDDDDSSSSSSSSETDLGKLDEDDDLHNADSYASSSSTDCLCGSP